MAKKFLLFSLLLRKGLKAILFLIPACLSLVFCSSSKKETSYLSAFLENPTPEDAEYEVYIAIIKNEYIRENTELVIIAEDTESFRIYDNEEDSLVGMTGVLLNLYGMYLSMTAIPIYEGLQKKYMRG